MTKNTLRTLYIISLTLIDVCSLLVALHAAYLTRFEWPLFAEWFPITKGVPLLSVYQQSVLALVPFFILIFNYIGFYRTSLISHYDELVQIIKGIVLCSLVTTLMTFVYRGTEYSRLVIGLWCVYSIIMLYVLREFDKWLFRRATLQIEGTHKVMVIGHGKTANAIREMMKKQPFVHLLFHEKALAPDELERQLQSKRIAEVLLIQGSISSNQILDISRLCEVHDVECRVVPDLLEIRRGEIILDGFFGIPTFQIRSLSLYGTDYALKRGFDIVVSLMLLIIFSIPLLLIALLIKLDSKGPVLYTQNRLGWRSRSFKLYKFRTMSFDADVRLEQLKHLSDRSGPVFKMKNDPRITRVGTWLRKFSIDEIPQVLNVLLGDMSLVGPRPQVLWEAAAYDEHAKKRLRVMPGITGLWQVSGRASLSYEEMINLDIYYLENWSLGLDLKILLRTLPAVFAKQGAY